MAEMTSIEEPADSFFKLDCDVAVRVRHFPAGATRTQEDSVDAHRMVLSSFSTLFQRQLEAAEQPNVDLSVVPNGLNAFRAVLSALYSGDVQSNIATPVEMLSVSRACEIPLLESKLLAAAQSVDLSALLRGFAAPTFEKPQPLDLSQASSSVHSYLHTMLSLWNPLAALCSAPFTLAPPTGPPSPATADDSVASRTQSESRSSGSSPRANSVASPPGAHDNEKIVPNDDKEGWCRNKKYIEKVEGGFMCTVCRKVYGRYNSVSYHVTIYHRNPPIRCDELGCNFSTREARYIHFHKYYRHHTPLPENIDLGSRKCPFCRHVSKSPAMLEKHIARHEGEGKKPKESPKLPKLKSLTDRRPQSEPILPSAIRQLPPTPLSAQPQLKCALCPFAGAADGLLVHLATSHAFELAQMSQPQPAAQPLLSLNGLGAPPLNVPLHVDASI